MVYFPSLKEKMQAYEITMLSVCEQVDRVSW
jgi:hypothetical protein